LVKVSVEVLWLAILLGFYAIVFGRTNTVAGWTQDQYLFFVGCFFTLNGLIETLFLENCNAFSELVRTGDLDFVLLKPIDEQFLVSCRRIDFGTAPNVLMGLGVMAVSLWRLGWPGADPAWLAATRVGGFIVLFGCSALIAYGFMLVLTSVSVWIVRNSNLMEMWWLFSSLARYPREIFAPRWARPFGLLFTFVLPILLVSNVPADVMVRTLEPGMALFTAVATVLTVLASRWFFRFALRSYRSASS
jgi:ABC-2 type transport system permease protein